LAEHSINFTRLRVRSWNRRWGIGARLSIAFLGVAALAIASNLLIQHEISVIKTTRLVRVAVPAPLPPANPSPPREIKPSAPTTPDAARPKSLIAAIEHYEVAVRARMGGRNDDGDTRVTDAINELEQESQAYILARGSVDSHQTAGKLHAKLFAYRAHGDELVRETENRRNALRDLWETFDALDARTKASLEGSWKIFGRVIARKPLVDVNSNLDEIRRGLARLDPLGFSSQEALDAVEASETALKATLQTNEALLTRSQGQAWVGQMQADVVRISALQDSLALLDRQRREREAGFLKESRNLMAEVHAAKQESHSGELIPNVPAEKPASSPASAPAPAVEPMTDTSETTAVSLERSERPLLLYWLSAAVLLTLLWISIRTVMSVVGPVRRMRAATSRLAGGDTAVRVARGGIRELDDLAVSFNQMAEQLSNAKLLASGYQERLEAKVNLRTRELQHLAGHDPLTELPNRRQLFAHLKAAIEQAETRSSKVAVFFVDLDNFKNVNDSKGHAFGDRVLSAIADRLLMRCGPAGFAARLGGDEFTVVSAELATLEEVTAFGQGLVLAFQQPLVVDGRYLTISISVGSSLYPDHGRDAEALLRAADAALFRAKVLGRSQSTVFSAALLEAASAKFSIEQGLRHALERGEFELVFQPEVDATTLTPHLVESLIRWRMPDGRLALPGEFLTIAEESGLILEISDWVLRKSIETASHWHHGVWPQARVAINLSSRQLLDACLVDRVMTLLREHRLPASCIEIELTENVLQTGSATIEVLRQLRSHGIAIALDDFGIGYSSLASLEQLPLSRVKLDRALVASIHTSPRSAVIARSLVGLCHNLGLEVTAEGIECVEQLSLLANLKPIYLQGYLVARPVSADELPGLVKALPDHMVSLLLMYPSKELRTEPASNSENILLRAASRNADGSAA
jgi:diguanylate cyclase (GGDEF)-like protein